MKNLRLLLYLLVFTIISGLPANLYAQLGMRLDLSQSVYLKYEPVFARLYIRNLTGQPLSFSGHSTLTFEIEAPGKALAEKIAEPTEVLNELILPPGATKELRIRLSDYYKLRRSGFYAIRAIIQHDAVQDKYTSNNQTFSIQDGICVWERLVGPPDLLGSAENKTRIAAPRKYKIISSSDGKDKYFYLVIEDDQNIYSIKRLSSESCKIAPEAEVDGLSRLHILHQVSPKLWLYIIYDINGMEEKRGLYLKSGSTVPMITCAPETGIVSINGGRIANLDQDQETLQDVSLPKLGIKQP